MTDNAQETASEFDVLKGRLDQIVEEIGSDGISLDDALTLYEEAVNIGLAACDVSENGIGADETVIEDSAETAIDTETN